MCNFVGVLFWVWKDLIFGFFTFCVWKLMTPILINEFFKYRVASNSGRYRNPKPLVIP